ERDRLSVIPEAAPCGGRRCARSMGVVSTVPLTSFVSSKKRNVSSWKLDVSTLDGAALDGSRRTRRLWYGDVLVLSNSVKASVPSVSWNGYRTNFNGTTFVTPRAPRTPVVMVSAHCRFNAPVRNSGPL